MSYLDGLWDRPAWMRRDDLACRGLDPAIFYPERGGSAKAALDVCDTCPARTECGEHAITHSEDRGIWGGMTIRERKRIRKQRAGITVTPCGTETAYIQHLAAGETPCQPCRLAHASAERRRRDRRRTELKRKAS